jgi:hypothetical protein
LTDGAGGGWAAAAGVRLPGAAGGGAGLLAGCTGLLAGCASAAAAGAGPEASCGATRTAANVPVIIKVTKGTVDCGTALRIENEYAAQIRAGRVPGQRRRRAGRGGRRLDVPGLPHAGGAEHGRRFAVPHQQRRDRGGAPGAHSGDHRLRRSGQEPCARRNTLGVSGRSFAPRPAVSVAAPLVALRPLVVLIICT